LHDSKNLPNGATLLSVGTTVDAIQSSIRDKSQLPNVVFVSPSCPYAAKVLPEILTAYPSIEWVHCRSAGIDFIESDALIDVCVQRSEATTPSASASASSAATAPLRVTNAKGQFSSSLAEYALGACTYFAKDFPRLVQQQQNKQWKNFDIQELYVSRRTYVIPYTCCRYTILLTPFLLFHSDVERQWVSLDMVT
jgi:phosphoglycerate dehydrogenase-like enzyme